MAWKEKFLLFLIIYVLWMQLISIAQLVICVIVKGLIACCDYLVNNFGGFPFCGIWLEAWLYFNVKLVIIVE